MISLVIGFVSSVGLDWQAGVGSFFDSSDAWTVAVQRMDYILTYGVRIEWTLKEMNEAYVLPWQCVRDTIC